MVWTYPNTVTVGEIWTSADYNLYVRDNLLETAVALEGTSGWPISNGVNTLTTVSTGSDFVTEDETTSSTNWTDLSTVGPTVTLTTGPNALVMWNVLVDISSPDGTYGAVSVSVTGATTKPPSSEYWSYLGGVTAENNTSVSCFHMFTDLTPGTNVFRLKYQSDGCGFDNRYLVVWPF